MKSRVLVWLGLLISFNGLASLSAGGDSRVGGGCRVDEGIYRDGRFRTCDRIVFLSGGVYYWDFFTLKGKREYRCTGQLPARLADGLQSISSTFPQQDGEFVYQVNRDSTMTFSHPRQLDAVLAYLNEKHLCPTPEPFDELMLRTASQFFAARCKESHAGGIGKAAFSLKRVQEFWVGTPPGTGKFRRKLQQARKVTTDEIIKTLSGYTGKKLGENPQVWINEFYHNDPDAEARAYTKEGYDSWAVISEPLCLGPTKQ